MEIIVALFLIVVPLSSLLGEDPEEKRYQENKKVLTEILENAPPDYSIVTAATPNTPSIQEYKLAKANLALNEQQLRSQASEPNSIGVSDMNDAKPDIDGKIPSISVFFEHDKIEISSWQQKRIKELSLFVKESSLSVELVAFTDELGSLEYNQGLSYQRIEAIKKLIAFEGMKDSNVKYSIRAKEDFIMPNKPSTRILNRRVDMFFFQKDDI